MDGGGMTPGQNGCQATDCRPRRRFNILSVKPLDISQRRQNRIKSQRGVRRICSCICGEHKIVFMLWHRVKMFFFPSTEISLKAAFQTILSYWNQNIFQVPDLLHRHGQLKKHVQRYWLWTGLSILQLLSCCQPARFLLLKNGNHRRATSPL